MEGEGVLGVETLIKGERSCEVDEWSRLILRVLVGFIDITREFIGLVCEGYYLCTNFLFRP